MENGYTTKRQLNSLAKEIWAARMTTDINLEAAALDAAIAAIVQMASRAQEDGAK